MAKLSLIVGAILVVIGVSGYVASSYVSPTALIPAAIGVVIGLLGLLARNEQWRRHAMHAAMGMADMHAWGLADWAGLFIMWAIMMVAMMLPSAAPVILLVLGVYRRRVDPQARSAASAFIAGYLVAWTFFSVAASVAQVGLHRLALLAPDMRLSSSVLSGVLLIVVGLYQWLPIKNTCLAHCQSPIGFLSQYWREGTIGGLWLGLRHGMFCVGCCWLLMTPAFRSSMDAEQDKSRKTAIRRIPLPTSRSWCIGSKTRPFDSLTFARPARSRMFLQ